MAQGAVFVQRLIDHVPAADAALITPHHGLYVIVHALEQTLAIQGRTFVILEDPLRNLAVPNQRVSHDEHVVLLAECYIAVRRVEGIDIGTGMDELPFQNIFRRDGVELRLHDGGAAGIAFLELRLIESRADMEIFLEYIFQCGCLRMGRRAGGQKGGQRPFEKHLQTPCFAAAANLLRRNASSS